MKHVVPFLAAAVLATAIRPGAAQTFTATDRQPTPEELRHLPAVMPAKAAALLREVKVPDDFDVTIFATPPAVNYPVFVATAPDGTLYVSSDGNGSIDRKPHLGRVLRVRDTNDDGQADEVKAFVPDVDSPRGLVWDHDRLYLLHPPDISVYIDHDRDGVADEHKTLVRGIAFTFKDRPADHSSNGLELGVDGWLYAAIGDFGFMEAVGTDGRKLQLRAGGVIRVRPDGTGLELWAEGTRNILEVAVSPLLDGFARDNTNDGGGWDVRLHHFSGLTDHGYPRLFKNFADEIVPPLADYGGGSGCGAAWIDEPGIPARWNNAPFTADWGREWIYHHGLTPNGATFTATQEEFIRLPRVTDLDVDARSALYAASWKGASFTWVGPEVGFIIRATPKGWKSDPVPDFETLPDAALVQLLENPSHRRRLEAQRTLLRHAANAADRRGQFRDAATADRLVALAGRRDAPIASRIAALHALHLASPGTPAAWQRDLLDDPTLAPWVLRVLGEPAFAASPDSARRAADLIVRRTYTDPRSRKESAIALARLGRTEYAGAVTPMLADPDPLVARTAVQALIRLKASDACLAIVDARDAAGALRTGALRVLQSLHEPVVVQALAARVETESDRIRRAGLLTALCRLHFVEGTWKGDSWGTRPDTRGPYYQPEPWSGTPAVAAALRTALDRADTTEAAFIGAELARHRIPAGEALDKLIARAALAPELRPAIAAQLAEAETVPETAIPLLIETATNDGTADAARAQSVIALTRTTRADAWRAILTALPRVQKTRSENNLAEKARSAVLNAPALDQVHAVLEAEAPRMEGESSLLAESLLLKLAARKIGAPEARAAASSSLDAGWNNPKRRSQILRAAAEVGDTTRAPQFVAALEDPDPTVAQAARDTVKRLKIDPEKVRAAAGAARIGDQPVEAVLAAVVGTRGERVRGEQVFTQAGCVSCHTVKADEPLKGPFLGNIATIYKRRELAEAILVPNRTIAQGFVANHFELDDETELDGFVVREAADVVTIRTITAQEHAIPVKKIRKREKQEKSLMPEGLAAGLTLVDLASLLDYLESLPASGK